MHDHEFERQVHQKMQELEFQPSQSVWMEVERRLRHRDKKRRWAIGLPLLLALLCLSGYLLYIRLMPTAVDRKTVARQETGAGHPQPGTSVKPQAYTPLNQDAIKENAATGDSFSTVQSSKINSRAGKTADTGRYTLQDANRSNKSFNRSGIKDQATLIAKNGRSGRTNRTNKNSLSGKKQVSNYTPETTKPGTALPGPDLSHTQNSIPDPDASESAAPLPSKVNYTAAPGPEINTALAARKPLIPTALVKLHKNSYWEWGVHLQGGRSSVSGSLVKSVFPGGALSNNFAAANPVSYAESDTRPGAALSAGVFFIKRLSRKAALSLGLNYTLLTTSIKTGDRIDSSLNALPSVAADQDKTYYRSGNTNPYSNNFHFISVPVTIRTQLNRGQQFPLYWNAGVSLSGLVASNALHYDNSVHIYVKDNHLTNNIQVAGITGLSMRFFSKHRFQLEAGPQVQYGLTRLLKNETASGRHFLFAGLKADVFLKRK